MLPKIAAARSRARRRRSAATARAAAGPEVTHFTLSNGLEVVVVPDHRAPVVTHMIWYKVGAADETPGKSGLAHFLEHLMFKGTEKNPGAAFSQRRRRDRRPGECLHRQRLYRLLPARAARASQGDDGARGRPHHRPGAHRRRGAARTQRRARRTEYAGRQQSGRAARRADGCRALSQPSLRPAGDRLAAGNRKARPEDALAFYRRFYTPNNAIVVVAGDVTADEVKADAEETYGKVADRAEINPRQRPMEPVQEAPRTVTLADSARRAAERQPRLSRAVGDHRQARRERSARRARPRARQRRELPAVPDARSSTRASRSTAGAYLFRHRARLRRSSASTASPKPGATLHEVEDGIDAVLTDVIEHGITADELDRAKNRLIADAVYAAGQSGDAGALVRRGAGDRPDRRHGPRLARPYPRRDRRCRAASRPRPGSTAAIR